MIFWNGSLFFITKSYIELDMTLVYLEIWVDKANYAQKTKEFLFEWEKIKGYETLIIKVMINESKLKWFGLKFELY